MKKTAKMLTALFLCAMTLTSCSKAEKTPEGYDLLQKAKSLYTELDSAHACVINNDAGIITQDFMFKYVGDSLTYSYIGTDGDRIYYEYNDGENLYYTDSDSTEWTTVPKSDKSYLSYTRENLHPLASKEAITISFNDISIDAITKSEDGSATITYIYDAEKISVADVSGGKSDGVSSFKAVAEIAPDGYCTKVTQLAVIKDAEGEYETDYAIEFTQMNEIGSIERPKASWES